ncbi:hypothetical protein LCGC14_1032890 [marine sediment metagenome]|uniref:Uncharacterized protein n=1 Tax=marine sediment metagenome TaxID=412755 RepID=A0A0F9MU43_9ZZZZ
MRYSDEFSVVGVAKLANVDSGCSYEVRAERGCAAGEVSSGAKESPSKATENGLHVLAPNSPEQ